MKPKTLPKIAKIAPRKGYAQKGKNYDPDFRFVFTGQIRGLVDDNGKPIK